MQILSTPPVEKSDSLSPATRSERKAPPKIDTGLACLIFIARFYNIALDAQSILHKFSPSGEELSPIDLARAAKAHNLKTKKVTRNLSDIGTGYFPLMFRTINEDWMVLGGVKDKRALVFDPIKDKNGVISTDHLEKIWSGTVMLVNTLSILPSSFTSFNLGWFFESIKKYKRLFYEIILASFFLQLFGLVTPLFFQVIIDKVLTHRSMSTLDVLAFGLLCLGFFEIILSGLRTWLFSHTAYRLDVQLGQRLFHHLSRLPIAYFNSRRVGDTVARVRELENLRRILTSSTLTLIVDTCFAFIFIVVMFVYSVHLALIVSAILPFYALISWGFTPLLRRLLERKFSHGAENQAFLVETITDIRTVKAMSVEPQFQQRWEKQLATYVRSAFQADNLSNILVQNITFLDKMTTALILWIGAKAVINDDITVGQLIAFNMLAQRVSGPIMRLANVWQDLQQAGVSMRRLGDILNAPVEPTTAVGKLSLPTIRGVIQFENVSFRYGPETPLVLDGVSFSLNPGESLGIVGQSGSGKSTIASLLQRFYVPEQGKVMVDGLNLNMADLVWLRRQLGVVLQENALFNKSVRDNIALAVPHAPMDAVIRVAQLAGAHEFIMGLPEGYDTMIGERGSTLSGGQRQRIAIARALLGNPQILLFDEATSALDYESEHIIKKNMQAISKGRTVVLIAHRLSTIMHCSHIIVIDKGRIIERGTHEALLQKSGYYSKLWQFQSKDAGGE